jgi:hypothetical protein
MRVAPRLFMLLLALPLVTAGQLSHQALRFFGTGTSQQDRIKIPIDPGHAADVGNDFTIEFWMRAAAADNTGTVAPGLDGDGWITGNVVVDRDVYGGGDRGDFGLALGQAGAGCVLAFGAHNGTSGQTIVGTRNVADDQWHHVALSRTRASGLMQIFVDGSLDASGSGPTGDLAYRDGRATAWPQSDPFLVFAAEKHDAGSAYPSFSGYLDEVRVWTQTYAAAGISGLFNRVISPGEHPGLVAYWRFEEGAGTNLADEAGTVAGRLSAGTAGNGEWVARAAEAAHTAPLTDAAITSPNQLRILLPLYAYPEWWDAPAYIWDDVAAQGSNAPITAIINPDSGPGVGFPNVDYVQGIADLRAGGVQMIGYVYTSYGARPLTNVLADIAAYAASTNVSGIFLDECANTTNLLAYYTQLYAAVHSHPGFDLVVVNPGTQLPEPFVAAPATDVAVIFEHETGWPAYAVDGFVARYPTDRFAALPYAVSNLALMHAFVDLAVRRNVGWIYVTDDDLPNPWDTLPAYWTNLAALVGAYRRTGATATRVTNQTLRIDWSLPAGRPFRVEHAATPVAGDWSPLAGPLTAGLAGAGTDLPLTNAARAVRLRLFP